MSYIESLLCLGLSAVALYHENPLYVPAYEYIGVAIAQQLLQVNISLSGLHTSKLIVSILFYLIDLLVNIVKIHVLQGK